MSLPELVAHRGYSLRYPENTIVGIEAAVRAGARYVEVDIQLSSDKQPVLFHDRTLARVCGVPGMIHEFPLDRLRALRASEFERFGYRFAQVHVATLAELVALLNQHPGVHAFVEIKRVAVERFGVVTVLDRVRAELSKLPLSQFTLISYALDFLLAARRQGGLSLGVVLARWADRKSAAVRQIAPQYLFADADDLPRWGRLRTDAPLVVYEVDDPVYAARLARRGAAFIETFAVGEMLQALDLRRHRT